MRERSEQPTAPYLDAVVAYAFRGPGRFHVPGHKGGAGADPGLRFAVGERALAFDVCQDLEGIDLGPSPTPYERAEMLAAEAYGVARSWFLTNGATQGNHAMCLALAPLGKRVIAQRNSHASLVDGLVLSGGRPSFVAPEYDVELGMANGVTPESVAAALRAAPDARAVFLVSPTYYGMVADVAGCAEVCHAAGVPLVVDQAWGPHFGFHPDLPRSAASQGADAVLTSTHKIAGSFTQSAMLHVVDAERIDVGAVGSRDAAAAHDVALVAAARVAGRGPPPARRPRRGDPPRDARGGRAARARSSRRAGTVRLIGEEQVGQPGVVGWDPMRIAIDVRATGCSGYDIADALRQSYDAQPELATHATIVLVVGIGERPEALERVAGDFDEVVKRIERPGTAEAVVRPPAAFGHEMAVPPRDAFLGDAQLVEVDDAVGRISCESIAGYPPASRCCCPGSGSRPRSSSYLRELVSSGARLHGASDPAFRTINALSEPGT